MNRVRGYGSRSICKRSSQYGLNGQGEGRGGLLRREIVEEEAKQAKAELEGLK